MKFLKHKLLEVQEIRLRSVEDMAEVRGWNALRTENRDAITIHLSRVGNSRKTVRKTRLPSGKPRIEFPAKSIAAR